MIPKVGEYKSVVEVEFEIMQKALPKRKWQRVYSGKEEKTYVYLCDSAGHVKIWNLTEMIESFGFEKVQPYNETVQNYFPSRSEQVNVSNMANHLRNEPKFEVDITL